MQNEPKFKKARMNVTSDKTKDYDNWTLGERGKNEPKTNPKRTQMQKTKNERKYCFNKELQRKMNNEGLCKTNPKRTQNEPKQTQFQKGYLTALHCVAQSYGLLQRTEFWFDPYLWVRRSSLWGQADWKILVSPGANL